MSSPLTFTGERFHPDALGDMWCEHWHRYHYVLPMVAGKKILDVACGEGYGSALLSSRAAAVSGVDISADAIAHAKKTYADKNNLDYIEASCVSLPFEAGTFDMLVSFETIEHIHEQAEFLDEIKRVLKPDGVLIISSPNKAEYTDKRHFSNEFHVKELYREELSKLIAPRFAYTQWLSQRNAFVSMIAPVENASNALSGAVFEPSHLTRGESITVSKAAPQTRTDDLPALYFILLASNHPESIKADMSRISTFTDSEEWAMNDYRHTYRGYVHFMQREKELLAECADLQQQLKSQKMNKSGLLTRIKRFLAG